MEKKKVGAQMSKKDRDPEEKSTVLEWKKTMS